MFYFILQLTYNYFIIRGNLKLAQEICIELGVMASPVTGVDMELKTIASLRHARTLLAAKQYSEVSLFSLNELSLQYFFHCQTRDNI